MEMLMRSALSQVTTHSVAKIARNNRGCRIVRAKRMFLLGVM
jgi:hypothetical protein